jgi:hypothetical protein
MPIQRTPARIKPVSDTQCKHTLVAANAPPSKLMSRVCVRCAFVRTLLVGIARTQRSYCAHECCWPARRGG